MAIKVTIVGVDTLGHSLALALRDENRRITVTLHDRNHDRATLAVKAGAGDRAEWNLPSAVEGADLVIINEPMHQFRQTLENIAPDLRPNAVVTDTQAVKAVALEWASELLPEQAHYVGGTPFVHADRARADLFNGRRYAVIPHVRSPEGAVQLLTDLVTLIGAEPLFIEAAEHDALMAAAQHLPALASIGLLKVAMDTPSWKELAAMTTPTFVTAARLPDTDPRGLAMMLHYNRDALNHWLGELQRELGNLRELLQQEERGSLEKHLESVEASRLKWEEASRHNLEAPTYGEPLRELEENRGLGRWFGFGRRRSR